jgi:hypothetical protein
MPIIDPVRKYQPLDPYHHIADNGPINDLVENITRINDVVESHNGILTLAIGTQGTLSARLNQSINDDGTLKTVAIDNANHAIASHSDGLGFVRMTDSERSKLSNIMTDANDLKIQVECPSTTVMYDTGILTLKASDSIHWRTDNSGVYADVTFPLTSRHRHYCDVKPTPLNTLSPDYITYHTTSVATPYVAGSLRVFVNGVRISHYDNDVSPPADTKFPRNTTPTTTWVSLNYTEDVSNITSGVVTTGLFTLSSAILPTDRIVIDFEVLLA